MVARQTGSDRMGCFRGSPLRGRGLAPLYRASPTEWAPTTISNPNKVRYIKLSVPACRYQHWTQSQHPLSCPTRRQGHREPYGTAPMLTNNLDYMVKPHGQLVLVSSTPHNASTPSLSTSWSWTALQDPQGVRENLSWEGLPA